jgi:hypothetical protein
MFDGQDGNFDRPAIALRIILEESGLYFPNIGVPDLFSAEGAARVFTQLPVVHQNELLWTLLGCEGRCSGAVYSISMLVRAWQATATKTEGVTVLLNYLTEHLAKLSYPS